MILGELYMSKWGKQISAIIAAAVMLSAMPFSALAEDVPIEEIISEDEQAENTADVIEGGETDDIITNINLLSGDGEPVPLALGFSGGDGASAATAYEISSAADLAALASEVNGGASYTNTYFKLTADIVLTGTWTPIGTNGSPFSGIFDGGNKKITGLNINAGSSDYQGLFGYVSGGTIENLTVFGTVTGQKHVGGIVGYIDGSGKVRNCTNEATINSTGGQDAFVAGIVGYNVQSTITDCINKGTVTGDEDITTDIGGIVGRNWGGTIEESSNVAFIRGKDRIGGIAGCNISGGTIRKCFNTGNIYGKFSIGGVVGSNNNSGTTIINCYNVGNVDGSTHVGGVAGWNNDTIKNCHNVGIIAGHDNHTSDSDGNPIVKPPEDLGGIVGTDANGTIENCYYLEDCNAEGTEFTNEIGTKQTSEQLASGETTYKLQNVQTELVWGQIIDGVEYPYPVFVKADEEDENKILIVKFVDGETEIEKYVYNGQKAEPPAADEINIPEGYELAGWTDTPDGTEIFDFSTSVITENKTFYPVFREKQEPTEPVEPPVEPAEPTEQVPPMVYNDPPKDTSSAESDTYAPEDVSNAGMAYEKSELVNGVSYAWISVTISIAAVIVLVIRKRIRSKK